jgi:hypothetical protein
MGCTTDPDGVAGDEFSQPPPYVVPGDGAGSPADGSSSPLLDQCIAAGKGGMAAKEQVCRMVPADKMEACWRHINDSRVAWIGWCHLEFSLFAETRAE